MRSYKKIMPIFLVLALVASVFYSVNSRIERIKSYNQALEHARDMTNKRIFTDAAESYKEAMNLMPSAELFYEAGEIFLKESDYYSARRWGRDFMVKYPEDAIAYYYYIQAYKIENKYNYLFSVYEEYQDRGLYLQQLEDFVDTFRYAYSLHGKYDQAAPFSNANNLAAAEFEGSWGYVNTVGEKALDYIYSKAGAFTEYASVIDANGRPFLIDGEANEKINGTFIQETDPEFGEVTEFGMYQGDYLWAYNGSIWNAYDNSNFQKLFGGFKNVKADCGDIAAVSMGGEKWALINSKGDLLTDYIFDEVLSDSKDTICRGDALIVRQGEAYYLVDRTGKQLGDKTFTDARAFNEASGAAVKYNGKWCFVDSAGNILLETEYDDVGSFCNGMAAVCSDGVWGYIQKDGEIVISPTFEGADPFSKNGQAFVKEEGKWKLLSLYLYNHD